MGKTFARVKLCHTNDFPSPQNENIKRWVENNGGTFQEEVGRDTTHLVCSTKAWKRNSPIVKEARRRNRTLTRSKRIKIVKYDWLEDSLSSKTRRPKPATGYDWEQKRHEQTAPISSPKIPAILNNTAEKAQQKGDLVYRKMNEFGKEIEEFEMAMHAKGYHPYADSTGFHYLIGLVRRDIEKNLIERLRIKVRCSSPFFGTTNIGNHSHNKRPVSHSNSPQPYPFTAYPVVTVHRPKCFLFRPFSADRKLRAPIPNPWAHYLQLFESDATPHKYASYLSYTAGRPGVKRETQPLAPLGSDWEFAHAMFTKIFKLKTGIEWDERPDWSAEKDTSGLQVDGETARTLKRYFEYLPPKIGTPQGSRHSGRFAGEGSVRAGDHGEECNGEK